MIYCINPMCDNRLNPDSEENCLNCGTPLLINDRIQLIKPLRELNPYSYNDIFEVTDKGTEWEPGSKQRIMKILKWNEPKLVELFEREADTLQSIDHPSIPRVTIDDFFTFTPNGTSITLRCLVMDKFEGLDLYEWIKENGKISEKLALNWLNQLVEILDELHHSEFFHRDIKPSNIVCRPNGKLALIDFGATRRISDTYLAKVGASGGTSTKTGRHEITSIITTGYSPTEQINGRAVPQSDFYALGRTFIHLLTGIPLDQLPTSEKTGRLIWRDKAPQINRPLANLIDDLQAELPGQRPQNTKVILQRLSRLPLQSKINKFFKSKPFKISAFILICLALFGVYKTSPPIIANFFINQGKKAEEENRFNDAQNNFDLALKLNKDSNKLISRFYSEQGFRSSQPEIARRNYESAIKFNNKDADAYRNLALVCQQIRDSQCIIKSYSAALRLEPNDWLTHYRLGSFYDDEENYYEAKKHYNLAIKQSNHSQAKPISNLARLYILVDQNYKKAQSLSLDGLNKTNNQITKASLYRNLGWVLFNQQQYTQAYTYLQQAVALNPQLTSAYCLTAKTQDKLNLTTDARLSWEVCLILESSLPEVRGWRQEILQRIL